MSPWSTVRRSATAIAAVAALSLLAACSSGSEAVDEPAAEATEAAADSWVLEDTYLGDVELPIEPQRVVALWRTGSILADLGVVPVGALEGELLDTELTAEQYAPVADVPTIGNYEGVDLEAIIELEPDLIVGMDHGNLDIDYTELAELYPLAILPIAEPTDVWRNYETLAQVVGRSTDYDERTADLAADLTEIADAYGDAIGDVSATSINSAAGTIWVDTAKALSFERIDAAGFGYNATYTTDPERYVTELSRENIPSLADQDVIFYSAQMDGSASVDVEALLAEPAFAELPAAVAGHVYPLRGSVVYTFTGAAAMVEDLRAAAEAYTAGS